MPFSAATWRDLSSRCPSERSRSLARASCAREAVGAVQDLAAADHDSLGIVSDDAKIAFARSDRRTRRRGRQMPDPRATRYRPPPDRLGRHCHLSARARRWAGRVRRSSGREMSPGTCPAATTRGCRASQPPEPQPVLVTDCSRNRSLLRHPASRAALASPAKSTPVRPTCGRRASALRSAVRIVQRELQFVCRAWFQQERAAGEEPGIDRNVQPRAIRSGIVRAFLNAKERQALDRLRRLLAALHRNDGVPILIALHDPVDSEAVQGRRFQHWSAE